MKQSYNGQELSYYGLYLRHYLQENRFQQASDADFIDSRAALAADFMVFNSVKSSSPMM